MADQQAPGRLEILREFINTLDVEKGADELGSPEEVAAWFRSAGLTVSEEPVTSDDLDDLQRLRESLRDLLHAESHGQDDPEARAVLNDLAARVRLQPEFVGGGTFRLAPRVGGSAAAMGVLLAIAVDAMTDGTWQRLKVCANSGCAWAFYDHSRNRSGRWCSMAVCGNRMKVQAYREREASQ